MIFAMALDPDRMNEPKFIIPEDNDATKAIPIITKDKSHSNLDDTIIHSKESSNRNRILISQQTD